RLVRDYGRAGRFIRAGGASSLLALPGESAFDGSTALVAVVFRHLLEDPATLQSAMETEIRAAFSRLSRASSSAASAPGRRNTAAGAAAAAAAVAGAGDRPPAVGLLQLMGSLRPLLVRDSGLMVRAAANVLRSVAPGSGGAAGPGTGGGDGGGRNVAMVSLATGSGGGSGGGGGAQQQER
ncbi:unnamed protein product, partial [Ectocarpus sp. 12 AP-2014]